MMNFRLPIFLTFIGLALLKTSDVGGQDIHFTLHPLTPLAFNPARTGDFYGTYRISGLYRDQYRSVAGAGAYSTPTFSIDANVLRGFWDNDWVSVGLFFYTDRSGTAGLTVQTFKVSAAYHKSLNKAGTTTLSFAYQTGAVQRFIKNPSKLVFEDITEDFSTVKGKDQKEGYLDHVGGLKLTSKYNKTDEFFIGLAANRFGNPNWSVLQTGGTYQLKPKVYAHAGLSTVMSDRIRFSPNVSFQKIMARPEQTFVLQGMIDYLYDPTKNIILYGGLGYRSGAGIGDALQVMLGAYYKEVKVMIGYDANISSLSNASGSFGGFEIAAQYIGRVYKRPNPDPIIFCPRF